MGVSGSIGSVCWRSVAAPFGTERGPKKYVEKCQNMKRRSQFNAEIESKF